MFYELVCVMVKNLCLTGEDRDLLFETARDMLRARPRKDATRRTVKTDKLEGVVKTELKQACLGTFVGIMFTAEVETDMGKGSVRYLVLDDHLNEELVNNTWLESNPQRSRSAAWN